MKINIDKVEKAIVALAFSQDAQEVASWLQLAHPDASVTVEMNAITIEKRSPLTGSMVATGWNQLANDPSTNAVMIATALTDAAAWMKVFPQLLPKLQKEWKTRSKRKKKK